MHLIYLLKEIQLELPFFNGIQSVLCSIEERSYAASI